MKLCCHKFGGPCILYNLDISGLWRLSIKLTPDTSKPACLIKKWHQYVHRIKD